jgi:hypothetical protein
VHGVFQDLLAAIWPAAGQRFELLPFYLLYEMKNYSISSSRCFSLRLRLCDEKPTFFLEMPASQLDNHPPSGSWSASKTTLGQLL